MNVILQACRNTLITAVLLQGEGRGGCWGNGRSCDPRVTGTRCLGTGGTHTHPQTHLIAQAAESDYKAG